MVVIPRVGRREAPVQGKLVTYSLLGYIWAAQNTYSYCFHTETDISWLFISYMQPFWLHYICSLETEGLHRHDIMVHRGYSVRT